MPRKGEIIPSTIQAPGFENDPTSWVPPLNQASYGVVHDTTIGAGVEPTLPLVHRAALAGSLGQDFFVLHVAPRGYWERGHSMQSRPALRHSKSTRRAGMAGYRRGGG